jgi:hypothetical protein
VQDRHVKDERQSLGGSAPDAVLDARGGMEQTLSRLVGDATDTSPKIGGFVISRMQRRCNEKRLAVGI